MELTTSTQHTMSMDEECFEKLFELAVNMAYGAFERVSDEHVQAVYARLVWNARHGLLHDGVVTVH